MKSKLSLALVAITFLVFTAPQSADASWWKIKKGTQTEEPCTK